MTQTSRRDFIRAGLTGAAICAAPTLLARRGTADPVLVVGSGPAGATAALALAERGGRPVALLERDPARFSRSLDAPSRFVRPVYQYDRPALRQAGVNLILDEATGVDWKQARLELFSGRRLPFAGLCLAPGLAPCEEGIADLDARARHHWPAAWGSPVEARRLMAQLAAAPEKAHVVLRLPADAGGLPAIAAGRALEIAAYLGRTRPAARLTVLDAAEASEAASIYTALASDLAGTQGGIRIDWRGRAKGGHVLEVDANRGLLRTNAGEIRADVVNFVPASEAAQLAQEAGLTDASGWCPCFADGRSRLHRNAVVLGDARKGARRGVAIAQAQGRDAVRVLARI